MSPARWPPGGGGRGSFGLPAAAGCRCAGGEPGQGSPGSYPRADRREAGKKADNSPGADAGHLPVLVSAGIELILFPVAGIVLCFGFRMRIMLITR